MPAAGKGRPGQDWLEILSRPTLPDFARAFAAEPALEASVLAVPIVGVSGIRDFFVATRSMYEQIAFTAEYRADQWTCLEWEGAYRALPVSGATILIADSGGSLERVRLFHTPLDQVAAFAADLRVRFEFLTPRRSRP